MKKLVLLVSLIILTIILVSCGEEKQEYTISFDTDGGSLVESLTTLEGTTISAPTDPVKDGYNFIGWYLNEELYEFSVMPKENITLVAKWEEKLPERTIFFDELGGVAVEDITCSIGTTITLPTTTKEGYVFLGWYLNEERYEEKVMGKKDITLTAKWIESDGFVIEYNLNGGSFKYQNREELLADFLADYNEVLGHSYASVDDIPSGNFANIDFHTFYTKVKADGTSIREKWIWLAEYLFTLSIRDLGASNCNVLGLSSLISNSGYSGDSIYGISYAFRAFLKGTTIRPGSSYTSADFSVYENAYGFYPTLSASENKYVVDNKGEVILDTPYLENYEFGGWYDNPEFTGEALTKVSDTTILYAKWDEGVKVESITITNKVSELKRYESLQLNWKFNPSNPSVESVKFVSSNENVAVVDAFGFITTLADGTVTIKVISQATGNKYDEFTIEVYSPGHFDAAYETNSYVAIGEKITLLASYIKRDGSLGDITWSSSTPDLAAVENGVVTGLKEGVARIKATSNDGESFEFVVTVLPNNISDTLMHAINAHESNVFIRYDLGIGAGTPAYYIDAIGSLSELLMNEELYIDTTYANVEIENKTGDYYSEDMTNIEFITVHYTGNMSIGSDAEANAKYFVGANSVSIHYTTGNDGVFQALPHNKGGFHAGSGSTVVEWIATGVKYTEGDQLWPTWGISSNANFTLNGKETSIKVPYKNQRGDEGYVTDDKYLNDQGFGYKVVNGEYYMSAVRWDYSQVYEGRIVNNGGNKNSIGIESCVDNGSDIWYTWHKTAQLVAQLMVETNLDITRVRGHHFFSGKDCPQPMLENNLELWWKFISMVEAEYELLTTYKDAKYSFEIEEELDYVNKHGRITEQPEYTDVVEYTVTVVVDGKEEQITLASIIEGIYCK